MVTIRSLSGLNYKEYDEVWAIVRSLKYANPSIKHVPELSPSWGLFKTYMRLRDEGNWNDNTFRNIYVPQFLKEMRGKMQQSLLNQLFQTDRHICLVCFCPDEELCHRSIIGGMLQGAGLDVKGLSADYSHYYEWWKNSVPGISDNTHAVPVQEKHIADVNPNVKYLYDDKDIFDDDIPAMCFTGRRPKDLCGYEQSKYQGFVTDLAELIYNRFYIEQGIRRFISGAAQGFDQMCFWAVERMKNVHKLTDVQNVVFTAFEGQETRWAKTGLFSQAEYWLMMKHAVKVVVVSAENTIESLFERSHAMCGCSACILALYPDDSWKMSRGGTAECMRYAADHALQIVRLGYTVDDAGLHMGEMTAV